MINQSTAKDKIMTSTITLQYHEAPIYFKSDAYLNATHVAKHFNKRTENYLRSDRTQDYMKALARKHTVQENKLVVVKHGSPETGGGTWISPKLAIDFARWLSADFAVWCDEQIESILKPTIQDPQTRGLIAALTKIDHVETQQAVQAQQLIETKSDLESKIAQVDIKARNGVPVGYMGRKEAWRRFGDGLSEDIFKMALDVLAVPTEKYIHNTPDGYQVVSWAYKRVNIPDAVDLFIDDAVQVSPHFCKSPMLSDRRFRFVKDR
jgi:hypothetical protein